MSATISKRDYSLVGKDSKYAEEQGLASAQWYACPISRKRLKELMQRKDGPAIRDTLVWFALLGIFGWLGWHFWGTWWCVPAFIVYGVLYCSCSDSRWHECGHRTPFKTTWMNDVVYEMASFMVLRESTPWRWSHTRHHTDTIIVGRDPEIAVPRPPDMPGILLAFFSLKSGPKEYKKVLLHCFGKLTAEETTYIPDSEVKKVFRTARVWGLIYAATIAWAISIHSILPLMLIGLPSFYGAWLLVIFGLTQHAGLAEDVLDHRLNCRTVYMNPVFRFVYWNMNYHVEHHMFPMVPYHALPALHAELKNDMPKPYANLFAAYREIIPAIFRQVKDPAYFVKRELPATVKPISIPVPEPQPTT
ncbi:MAG TPA: fatty acid desaturase family protein [Candidatus Sulfotelmatobacter sp.]|nr:fatty acid desaturase family protein [Candidatus Sulfotelmatobacter sp.]